MITLSRTRDSGAAQTQTFTPSGGTFLDSFTLDTNLLAGGESSEIFREAEEGGDFRSIQYQITQTADNSNLLLNSFSVLLQASGASTEDNLDGA